MSDPRRYPKQPLLGVSAAIIRDRRVLVVRRARAPTLDVFTLPGGLVEAGETLTQALVREIAEEIGVTVEPVALAGYREVIERDAQQRVERHFVVLAFAARWLAGEPAPGEEIAEMRWIEPAELVNLRTSEGLDLIVAEAFRLMAK